MDRVVVQRYAKLIISISRGLSEVDPSAQATCSDIVGKTRTNNKQDALKKIASAMAQSKIASTHADNENIFDEIQRLL